METECQSLDLHQTPNQTNPHWKPDATWWTYTGLQAYNKRIRNANRWAYIHLLTHTGRRRVSIATRAREWEGLNRNEGERKELVLVVSQTRQDIASRAYVSHLDMRIRVAVVRLNCSRWFVFFKWTTSLRNLPDARPLETYSPVVEGVDVSLRGDNVCLCFRKAHARKEVLYEGTVLP